MIVLSDESSNRPANKAYLGLAAAHQAVFALLPSGSGDAAFPLLARLFLGQSPYAAVVGLAVVRLQDLVTLVGIGLNAALCIWVGGVAGTAGILGISLLLLLVLSKTSAVIALAAGVARRIIALVPLASMRKKIDRTAADLVAWFQTQHKDWNRLVPVGLGVASWISATCAVACAMAAAGLPLELEKAAFILFVLNLAGAMSILTFAGLGLVEVGLAGSLMLFGIDKHQAVATAIAVRLLLLSFNLLVPIAVIALAMPGALINLLTKPRS